MFTYQRILASNLLSHLFYVATSWIRDPFQKYKHFHFFRYSLTYLCPWILSFLKRRDASGHYTGTLFFSTTQCPSCWLHKHSSTYEDISKHSISNTDAVTQCVLQHCCFSFVHLVTMFHQCQPMLQLATLHSFFLFIKLHPFLNLTSKELVSSFYAPSWFSFLCYIYDLTLACI